MRPKGKFKAHGTNPLRIYRRKRTDAQVLAYAEQCRMQRLQNRTKAEMRLCELLDDAKINYEVEKIFPQWRPAHLGAFFIASRY
jgi:hypothetical protein